MARASALWALALCFLPPVLAVPVPVTPGSQPVGVQPYEVYAVRFATMPYRVSRLVVGADPSRTIDLAMMVWVVKGPGRTMLVDAGFYRDKFLRQWKPSNYLKPTDALTAGLAIAPDEVTDIILSHVHWDHADGLDLFPRARVWIQRDEYQYYVGDDGSAAHSAIDGEDAAMLFALHAAGRLTMVDGDAQPIAPGITVYTGGKHTYASQYASVQTRSGTVIIASDNVYLYENLEQHAAIAQTLDAASNLAAQARMASLASTLRLIVPGHDPAVFDRFPTPGHGVARID
jgi:glyoxylase-like metal-dependent hydrolase (beta-lactamase superfamily II)